jgi:anti-sigma regulatory factor (Ser/Thr protein kinase)
MSGSTLGSNRADGAFRHETLIYAGIDEFLGATVPFIANGIAAGEPVLVVVCDAKIERLREEINGAAAGVHFADMAVVGRNPARIIPAWRAFVDRNEAEGRGIRGIGEPIWPGRSAAELVECHHHESLLNLAFAGMPDWQLLCPYDTSALEDEVLETAEHNHPLVRSGGIHDHSRTYIDPRLGPAPFCGELPEPAIEPRVIAFIGGELSAVRRFIGDCADDAGLDQDAKVDLVLAANELAANSVRHGGGHGVIRIWPEDSELLCEISDEGWIQEPLVGRERPQPDQTRGRGLWVANQICDLVQIRSGGQGTTVRLHMSIPVN